MVPSRLIVSPPMMWMWSTLHSKATSQTLTLADGTSTVSQHKHHQPLVVINGSEVSTTSDKAFPLSEYSH